MAFVALATSEVDAKSPIDDALTVKIKDNFDDLDARTIAAGAKVYALEVFGDLSYISAYKRSLAMTILNESFQPTRCRFVLKKSGTSALAFDIRKQTSPKTVITEIAHQYTAATQSVARAGSALNTQSVARFVSQISTQSITHAKASNNIQSIILLGTIDGIGANLVQYNLASSIDSDTVIGDGFVAASCSNAANDGTFTIIEKNRHGGNNVVISSATGVAQTGAVGTVQIKIMSYNYTNPVSATGFTGGYSHDFASHTSALNDGDLAVYAINQAGNNIWVKNNAGVVQGGVAGTADTNFWAFALTSSASATDYIVGETALTASHTSGNNNGAALPIIAVNSGANNLVLYNTAGVVQGGVAGTINTNRWVYALPSDPSSDVTAGDTMDMLGHTSALNDGTFTIKEVKRGAANNVVIYSLVGVAQASTPGTVSTTKKLVKFAADQSAVYTTSSYIEIDGSAVSTYNVRNGLAPFRVTQVNRGGGANYNVVIDCPTGAAQASPAGFVCLEMKSIFNTAPSLAADVTGLTGNRNPVGTSTDFITQTITAQTPLALYITSMPSGDPQSLTVTIL